MQKLCFRAILRYVGVLLTVYFAYYASAKLGLKINAVGGFASLVWPPTGISLAALVLGGTRLWPAVALAAFQINYEAGASIGVALGIAFGNTAEALIGASIVCRNGRFQGNLERLEEVISLIVYGALISTLVSASCGVLTLVLSGTLHANLALSAWRAWYVGDGLGNLIVAPVILVWRTRPQAQRQVSLSEIVLYSVTFVLVVMSICLIISPIVPTGAPLMYLVFPHIIWAALRFGQRGVVTSVLVLAVAAIWAMASGAGPFPQPALEQRLLFLQLYIGVLATTGLVLGAAIAELQSSERKVREQAKELERSNRDLEQVAVLASHDLQAPLRTIERLVERAARNLDQGVIIKARACLDHARAGISKLQDVTIEVLKHARVSTKRNGNAIIDLELLLSEIVDGLKALIVETGAVIQREKLPMLEANKTQLYHLFQNLIVNSIKYRKPGIPPLINISCSESSEEWTFHITDNGVGIDDGIGDRIFLPYERSNAEGNSPGTGIGLTLCKRIVEYHGGRIWFTSRAEQGSTFSFTIMRPIKRQAA